MRKLKYKIVNVVALADLGPHLSLEKASRVLSPSYYNPEDFAALIWKPRNTHISVLLFSSGKAVITGAQNEAEIIRVLSHIREVLEEKDGGHE